MTISLGSIDPCFSCTDRLETIDVKSGVTRVWSPGIIDMIGKEKG
jgi:Ni,Fe-hydrogenase III large subunit